MWQWQQPAEAPVCNQCQGVSWDLWLGSRGGAALLPWWNAWEHLCGMRRVERETRGTPHTCTVVGSSWGISFGFGFIFIANTAFFG